MSEFLYGLRNAFDGAMSRVPDLCFRSWKCKGPSFGGLCVPPLERSSPVRSEAGASSRPGSNPWRLRRARCRCCWNPPLPRRGLSVAVSRAPAQAHLGFRELRIPVSRRAQRIVGGPKPFLLDSLLACSWAESATQVQQQKAVVLQLPASAVHVHYGGSWKSDASSL